MLETDSSLLHRAEGGDEGAFDELVERHRDAVFRFAVHLTSNRADAEDVLQQTFLSAWRARAEVRAEPSARPWLLTTARHAAARLRRKGPHDSGENLDDLLELGSAAGFGDTAHTPSHAAELAEDVARLHAAIAQLPAGEREVLVLRDLEGLDGESVAQLLELALPAMKSRLHRARLRLAAALRHTRTEGKR